MDRRTFIRALGPVSLAGCLRLESDTADVAAGTDTESSTQLSKQTTEQTTAETTTEQSTDRPTESTTQESSDASGDQPTLYEVQVDWEHLESTLETASSSTRFAGASAPGVANQVYLSHVAIRLRYPSNGAVYSKAVQRENDEDVIQMVVPATSKANLAVVAVNSGGDSGTLEGVASFEGFSIEESATTQMSTKAFEWLPAEWHVQSAFADEYQDGTFTVDKGKQHFDMGYVATYPFPGTDLGYQDLLIQLRGRGGPGENLDDYHEYFIRTDNPTPGEASESDVRFKPVLASEKFNLPSGEYLIPPEGTFTIRWR
ncbi:hypothetical protein [Haloarchaeobius sp. TZWSO28]|uniref:hypothetical protein n=1 Tax=Haloarchaeobius sp. TZWSO28 TaxID=3446119 RepID=UPI003EB91F29